MRPDLQALLNEQHIEPQSLSLLQRILLTTDGTLTDMLELCTNEPIQVAKLTENIGNLDMPHDTLQLKVGERVMSRKILLQGVETQKNWVYAESDIAPDRLEPQFRDELLASRTPIGKLWLDYRVETFKEMLALDIQVAGELAVHFGTSTMEKLLCRTYRVYSRKQPIMLISEKFPVAYFG